jgi:phosphoribosyl 1,2-cyclic phosphodiesterase
VDAGLSRKETFERILRVGIDPESLSAILITHEHADHVAGLPAIIKKLDVPVYVSRLTAPMIFWGDAIPRIEHFQAGASFRVGDIDVASFTVPHDAIDPVGFTLRADGIKVGIVTDLGYLTESVKFHLRGSNLLLLECNHDLEMLKVGPYPWSIKQRVMGRRGHLSNDAVSTFIRRELDIITSTLILGHLSEHNNHPELVRMVARKALAGRELFTKLVVLEPRARSEVFCY